MTEFRHSFCDPFKPDVIELGAISSAEIIDTFQQIPWEVFLVKMDQANDSDIYFSPSLEFENKKTRHGVSISGLGKDQVEEFYVFYKRPKKVKRFFGLIERDDPDYLTEIHGQSKTDVITILNAFVSGNYDFLDNKIR